DGIRDKLVTGVQTCALPILTIQNKVTELAAGTGNYFSMQFSAGVENDPTRTGVTWTLTANGTPCSPSCGTLSSPVGTFNYVTYKIGRASCRERVEMSVVGVS